MHRFQTAARAVVLAVLASTSLAFAAGCSSSDAPSETMSVAKTCLATKCEQRENARSRQCSSCMSACFGAGYDCDVDTACDFSCGDSGYDCSDSDREECAQTGWKAELPATADPGIETACKQLIEAVAACGTKTVSASVCTRIAKTERPEVKSYYECARDLPCDADEETAAACSPEPTTFGDELCAPVGDDCTDLCTEEGRQILNAEGPWLRDDVKKAAMDCRSAATCSDISSCKAAWWSATID